MNLTPREKDKLLVSVAAMVAERRLKRGVRLNYPEAVALITDFVLEGARDGRSVAELMRDLEMVTAIVNRAQRRLAGAAAVELDQQQRCGTSANRPY